LVENASATKPATLYGTAKAATWQGLHELAQAKGLSTAWARVFFLYGPREPRGKLVADAVCALLDGGTVATTPGLQRRDFIHVGDAGRAIAMLAASDVQGPVNIASGDCVPVRDVLAEVERATGISGHVDYGARTLPASEPLELAADVTRLRGEVGFTPQHSLASGMADTVRWWREAASQPR
jgi:nucleoside-diphosphate-sugar epimerase